MFTRKVDGEVHDSLPAVSSCISDWDVSLQVCSSLIKLKFCFFFFNLMGVYFPDMDWQPVQSVPRQMSTEDRHKPPSPAKIDFNFWPFFINYSPGSWFGDAEISFFSRWFQFPVFHGFQPIEPIWNYFSKDYKASKLICVNFSAAIYIQLEGP